MKLIMNNETLSISQNAFQEFLLYTDPNGKVNVEISIKDNTIWMTQEKIAMLFGIQRPAVTKHLSKCLQVLSC